MTEEELDLLASSYLDGEATPEEVVVIERDPELRARVEALRVAQRALRSPVRGPVGLKEQQLAAALAAFAGDNRPSGLTVVGDATGTPAGTPMGDLIEPTPGAAADDGDIIDLRDRQVERNRAASRMRWLSAAAGVALFAAGGVFVLNQTGVDDGEFATDAPVAETESLEAAGSDADESVADSAGAETVDRAVTADEADDEAMEEAQSALESEAMAADAEEDFALDEDDTAADDAAETADGGDGSASNLQPPREPLIREYLAEDGFFPAEPVITYPDVPTGEELVTDLSIEWRTIDTARCAVSADRPDGSTVIAYLPIEITRPDGATETVEALYLTIGNRSQVILVDPETCEAA